MLINIMEKIEARLECRSKGGHAYNAYLEHCTECGTRNPKFEWFNTQSSLRSRKKRCNS